MGSHLSSQSISWVLWRCRRTRRKSINSQNRDKLSQFIYGLMGLPYYLSSRRMDHCKQWLIIMHNQRKHPQNDLPNRQLQTPDTTTTPNHLTCQHPHNPLQHNIGMAKILSQQKTVLYIMQIHQKPMVRTLKEGVTSTITSICHIIVH